MYLIFRSDFREKWNFRFWGENFVASFDCYYFWMFFESIYAKYMVNELSEIYFCETSGELIDFKNKILTS